MSLNHRRGAGDFDGLLLRAHSQLRVDLGSLIDLKRDSILLEGFERGIIDLDAVLTGRELGDGIGAGGGGRCRSDGVGFNLAHCDRRSGDEGSARVGDSASD